MRIVCATDFSEPARAASQLAGALAAKLGDSVKLLHVVELPPLVGDAAVAAEASWEKAMSEAAERELARDRQALHAAGVSCEVVVELGPASELIRTEAAAPDVRLVVLGTHGRKGAAHFFLGSVAEDVARTATCPVVVTRGVPFPEDGLDPRSPAAPDGGGGRIARRRGGAGLGQAACGRRCPAISRWSSPAGRRPRPNASAWRRPGPGARRTRRLLPLLDRELRRWAGPIPGEGEVRFRFPTTHGRIAEDLATEAEVLLPDLVVLGVSKRRFGGLSTLSPHAALLHAIKIPVVCVPEALRPPPEGGIPVVETVMVGTDMSDFSNQAIAGAYSLLRGTGGQVEICYVYERGAGSESAMDLPAEAPPLPSVREEIERKLRQLIPREAAALGISSTVKVVESNSAADGLVHEAERIGADVLVIASHGATGIKRLLGSVADQVVRHSTRPVLVLYPRPR